MNMPIYLMMPRRSMKRHRLVRTILGLALLYRAAIAQTISDNTFAVANNTSACNSFSAGPNMPTVLTRAVGVSFPDGNFYTMGGRTADTAGSDFQHVLRYSRATDTWTQMGVTLSDNQTSNMACGVMTVSGTPYIYCVGGSAAAQSVATARVFFYNPTTDTATTLTAADNWPGDAAGTILPGGFAVVNNKLYILGGFNINVTSTNEIWEFDPTAGVGSKWIQKVSTPEGIMFAPTCSIGGIIYVGGASDYSGGIVIDTTNSFSFNPATNMIGMIAPIPRATGETRALAFNGKMLVMGGGRVAPNPSNEVDIYDPGTNSWTTGSPVPAFMAARRNFPTDTDGSTIWLSGGYASDSITPLNSMEINACDSAQLGPTFVVTSASDHDDGVCGTVDCTLREAINAANAGSGSNTITFGPSAVGTITLSLGNLTVTDSTDIIGPGARLLTVRGNGTNFVFQFSAGTSTVSGLTISGGSVIGLPAGIVLGGGILNSATLTLSDCILSGNQALGGDNSMPGGNGGASAGGAIGNSGALTLNRCTFVSNIAKGGAGGNNSAPFTRGGNGGAGEGGAIFNKAGATLTINNCTFFNNYAIGGAGGSGTFGGGGGNGSGGAVFNLGTMTVTAATISGNIGSGGAGGNGNNIANNGLQGLSSGGLTAGGGSSTVGDTISAGNHNNHGGGIDVDGAFNSNGYNLIGTGDQSSGFSNGTNHDQVGTDASPINAQLVPPQDNGGPTDTMALLSGSPAIDTGDPNAPSRDQRGFTRVGIPDKGAFEFNGMMSGFLANISTRGFVGTGNNVLIGGIIVRGAGPKKLIIRALGTTLGQPPFNLPGVLADPTLELFDSGGAMIASNDNWMNASNASEISATGLAPPNSSESAILTNLNPGNYTAIVHGANNTTGLGLVEAYDLETTGGSEFVNISTRGFVQTGNNIMIAGVIVQGSASQKLIIRALGPTLTQFMVPNVLADPTLDLRDAHGNSLMTNDNWQDSQQAEIQASGFAPPNNLESAILITLAPANYTAILRGKNNTIGNALVEVYALP